MRTVSKRLALLAAVAAGMLAVPGPASAAGSPSCPNANAMPLSISPEAFDDAILCLLNRERTSRGMVALRVNSKLGTAATAHSVSMRQLGYFEHDEPGGDTFSGRMQASGYARSASRWLVGENIAWGTNDWGTPRYLMNDWMNSPGHRANVLERRFREIGVGVAWGSPNDPNVSNSTIATTDFGYAKRHKGN